MDDIVDIDQALTESFCLQSDEVNDYVQQVVHEWKEKNREVVQTKNETFVDTRTFTRPKKKIFEKTTTERPTVNLQIGGPVTYPGGNHLPCDSINSEEDHFANFLSDHMKDSLITSGDFTNVTYFKDDINDLQIGSLAGRPFPIETAMQSSSSTSEGDDLLDDFLSLNTNHTHNQNDSFLEAFKLKAQTKVTTKQPICDDIDKEFEDLVLTTTYTDLNSPKDSQQTNTETYTDLTKSDSFDDISEDDVLQSTPLQSFGKKSRTINLLSNISPINPLDEAPSPKNQTYQELDVTMTPKSRPPNAQNGSADNRFDLFDSNKVASDKHTINNRNQNSFVKVSHDSNGDAVVNHLSSSYRVADKIPMDKSFVLPNSTVRLLRRSRLYDDSNQHLTETIGNINSTDNRSHLANGSRMNSMKCDRIDVKKDTFTELVHDDEKGESECTFVQNENREKENAQYCDLNESYIIKNVPNKLKNSIDSIDRNKIVTDDDVANATVNLNSTKTMENQRAESLQSAAQAMDSQMHVPIVNNHKFGLMAPRKLSTDMRFQSKDMPFSTNTYKLQYPMKTSSVDSLDKSFADCKKHQNLMNIKTARNKSHSSHSLLKSNKDSKSETELPQSTPSPPSQPQQSPARHLQSTKLLGPPSTAKDQANLLIQDSDSSRLSKLRRPTRLIRPSSGYFSSVDKANIQMESGKKSILPTGLSSYSSCRSLNTYESERKLSGSDLKNIDTQPPQPSLSSSSSSSMSSSSSLVASDPTATTTTTTTTTTSVPSAQPHKSSPTKLIFGKSNTIKRSCLPRPMSMANK